MPIKNQKNWYDSYYSHVSRYSRLNNFGNYIHLLQMGFFVHVPEEAVIIDVGCGDGNVLRTLHEKGYDNLHGFDIKLPPDFMEAENRGLHLKQGDMLEMPYPDDFTDVIICFDSMHHLLSYEAYDLFLKNCRRVLKEGGKLFIFEPRDNFLCRIKNIIIKIPFVSDLPYIKYHKIYTNEEKDEIELFFNADLRGFLTSSGFEIVYHKNLPRRVIVFCRNKHKKQQVK